MNTDQRIKTRDTSNRRVVLVGGCFDFIHFGHISFLKEAKALGDYVIVALESDETVRRLKGEGRPIHTQDKRKAMLESLACVDEVICLPPMHTDDDYRALVVRVHPAVIAITEGDPLSEKKKSHADAVGARCVVIPKVHTPSTSQLAKLLELK